jgi:hypothetical protein
LIVRAIRDIFHNYNPRKLADVDGLISEWEGEERLLLAKVRAKYLPGGGGGGGGGGPDSGAGGEVGAVQQKKRWWQRG